MKKAVVIIMILAFIMSITCAAANEAGDGFADELFEILDQADRAATWTTSVGGPDFEELYGTVDDDRYIDPDDEDNEYRRVRSGFGSISELKSYFSRYMSEELAEKYLTLPLNRHESRAFIEHDGKLYYTWGNGTLGSYNTSRETDYYEIIKNSKDRVTLRYYPCYEERDNTYNYTMDKDLYYDYEFEKNGEGKYVVTNLIPTYAVYSGREKMNKYIEKLDIKNPSTSDSSVYITAAAGLIALCCAVAIKKKIKE